VNTSTSTSSSITGETDPHPPSWPLTHPDEIRDLMNADRIIRETLAELESPFVRTEEALSYARIYAEDAADLIRNGQEQNAIPKALTSIALSLAFRDGMA
jgi:hypothetical protein